MKDEEMTGMIDRVAKALQEKTSSGFCTYEEAARAAIEAMREPTDRMIEDGCDYDEKHLSIKLGRAPTPEECQADEWKTMIDAALREDASP